MDREFEGVKTTLRDFIIQAAFIRKSTLPGPLELMQQVDSILRLKKSKEIVKKIFVDAVVIGVNPKKAVIAMKEMIQSYKEIMNEYNQHKNYYLDLMQAFSEVISIEC